MKKLMLTCAMSLMLLSTSAMALTINVEPKKEETSRAVPPPPSAVVKPQVTCKYAEPKCDRHDRIHAERYDNDQKMYSRGECFRGQKERRFDFYCSNGEVWMQVDSRRDRADRIDCMDPRRHKFFAARSIRECEDLHRDYNRPEPPRKRHHHRD